MLPQVKAREESNFFKFLFWKWIPLPDHVTAHCICVDVGGFFKYQNLSFFLQQSAVGAVQGLFCTEPG